MAAGPVPRTCAVSTGFRTNYGRNHKGTGAQTREVTAATASFASRSRTHKSQHPMDPTESRAHLGAGCRRRTQASAHLGAISVPAVCSSLGITRTLKGSLTLRLVGSCSGELGPTPAPHRTPSPAALPLVSHNDHPRALRGPDTRHSQHDSPSLCSP